MTNTDKILVCYIGDISNFGASTFKRLFGWEKSKEYIGIVVGDSIKFTDPKNGNHCFTHWLYNIELDITIGKIQMIERNKLNVQLNLFE